jgi:hypothetical protein
MTLSSSLTESEGKLPSSTTAFISSGVFDRQDEIKAITASNNKNLPAVIDMYFSKKITFIF